MSAELTPIEAGGNFLSRNDIIERALFLLKANGLDYGSFFPMDQLRSWAGRLAEKESDFAFFKMGLAEQLLELGFKWSEAGLNGSGVRIGQAVENYHFAERWLARSGRDHDRAQLLLSRTDQSRLTPAEQERDRNMLRIIQHQKMMLRRRAEVVEVLQKHKPGLLREDIVI
jgi:hypothetical protein